MRTDSGLIYKMIEKRSKVIDLGCGEGELMTLLEKKKADTIGIDNDREKIEKCISKGQKALHYEISEALEAYKNNEFDYAVLNQTLQTVEKPIKVLKDASRISKKVIVAYPNFGFWNIRWQLMFLGKMPKSKALPYEWFNTPNIHLFTIKDFIELCKKNKLSIEKKVYINNKGNIFNPLIPNLFADNSVFVIKKKKK